MHRLWVGMGILSTSLYLAEEARAAPCDCDVTIELDVGVFDGSAVQPGQSVCVRGGPREYLRLQKISGTEDQKIVVRNCEGVVDISNDDRGYALTVDDSRHIRVTGTGEDGVPYGFRARAARTGPDYSGMSVSVGDLSTNIELDHVEAYEAGFAGINWKTESRCDGSANLGNFVMYDSKIHDNYVHDTGGEGLYFGSTGYGGRVFTCDGEEVTLYPHEHHGADIHDNIFEHTGWDGAQIGVTPVDCAFHHNLIHDVGLGGELYQQQGLQIGGASSCEVYSNVLMDGPTNGIFILGADDTLVYNNLIIDFGDSGIYANDQDQPLDARFRFAHNTIIVGGGMRGLTVFGAGLGPGWAFNNAIAGPNALGVGNEVPDFVQMANMTADTPDSLGFVDPAARDFHLREDSPLRDAGVAPPDVDIPIDLENVPRDDGSPDIGVYEWSPDPPPGETTTTDPGPTTGEPDDTGEPGDTGDTDEPGGTTIDDPTNDSADDESVNTESDTPTGDAPTSSPATTNDATGTDSSGMNTDDGCGCTSTATSPWLALLLLAPRRRRRAA